MTKTKLYFFLPKAIFSVNLCCTGPSNKLVPQIEQHPKQLSIPLDRLLGIGGFLPRAVAIFGLRFSPCVSTVGFIIFVCHCSPSKGACSSNTSFNVVNHFVIWKLFTGLLFVSFTQNCQIGTFSFEKVTTYYRNMGCFLTTSYLNCWYNFALIYQ